MTVHRKTFIARTFLAAGLLLGVAAANAASGYTIEQAQESQVTAGMSQTEVLQALGHPAQNRQYGNEPGPTFTYHLAGLNDTLFDVDFGANGNVASVSERQDESSGGRHGRGGAR